MIALGARSIAFCLVMPSEMLLHDVVYLDLVLLLSSQISYFMAPGSSFTLSDCRFFLIIITTSLVFIGGLVTVYGLVISAVELNSYALTDVSG